LQNALRSFGEAQMGGRHRPEKQKRQQGCWRYESKVQSYPKSMICEKQIFVKRKGEKAAREPLQEASLAAAGSRCHFGKRANGQRQRLQKVRADGAQLLFSFGV
jgi:hypothetical protein